MKEGEIIRKGLSFTLRKGCDVCKRKLPTERFDGYMGGVLWVCGECYKEITLWRKKKKSEK